MSIPERTRLGRYEIRSLLGAGGMGEVYQAYDLSLHRLVAIKVLRADLISNINRLRRFEREAYSASSLNHPNIITIYEIGHQDDYHFIVTELVDGESLAQRLRGGPLKLDEVLSAGIQISSALAAAHEAGIIHRDIKPDNVMLRRDQLVKVLDFGLAKLNEPFENHDLDEDAQARALQLTIPGVVMGTARYMSPEQTRGLAVDGRTDIWSLGVVLFEITAGQPPFNDKTVSDIMAAVLTSEPPLLSERSPGVPAELQRIVKKALRKDPKERYQTVTDLESDLKSLKHRFEFETEFGRPAGKTGPETTTAGHTKPATASASPSITDSELTRISRASSAEYLIRQVKSHKWAAMFSMAVLLTAVFGAAYLVYRMRSAAARPDITSIAVLPFTNTSNDPEQEYLSNGISESLINRLSQLPGVKVIANSSSSRFTGGAADPKEVARALNVGAVVTGRILERGDNLSISVELIDARDRSHLWGENYNRKANDLLQVQADISAEIAEKLRLQLTRGQQQQLATSEVVNPAAYELLLKGRFYRSRGSVEDRKKAAASFDQAIALDPAYASAYADLSDIYRSLVANSILDPKTYLPKARAAALKALELNENLAEAHFALANLQTYDWEWESAEREYKRAIELNPNLALAHRWYASYLRLLSRRENAISEIRRARELDPLSPGVNATVGFILVSARENDQAIESLKQTLELDPNYPYTHLFLGMAYSAKGMHHEAIAAYQKAMKLGLDSPSTKIYLGAAFSRAGDRKHAQEILSQLVKSQEYVSPGELAILYAALGEHEEAFASLEKAYQTHDLQLQYLGVSYAFDPLRSDPRFQDLLRRVGLPGN